MKKLPTTIESCAKCPFRIVYPNTEDDSSRYKDFCRLTGDKINAFGGSIHRRCPLEDVGDMTDEKYCNNCVYFRGDGYCRVNKVEVDPGFFCIDWNGYSRREVEE